MRLLAAPDKFKGTLTSAQAGDAVCGAARTAGWDAEAVGLSDGGDGLLDVFGGADREAVVTGPAGTRVRAGWRLEGGTAVIESATASGLVLAGGAEVNDPVSATSRGTGELIEAAVLTGAGRVVVGLGGSATTDGGLGAIEALSPRTVELIGSGAVVLDVCCDVDTVFARAAVVFGPQKGASPDQVRALTDRLAMQQVELRRRFGVDVSRISGGGAAGGLGGALAAIGGRLRSGFDLVAEHADLERALVGVDVVVTGEGRLDRSSFTGKVVGGVLARARPRGIRVVIIAGSVDDDVRTDGVDADVVSLVQLFGHPRATGDAAMCLGEAVASQLERG